MLSDKIGTLKQDLADVKGVIEDLKPYASYLDGNFENLLDKFEKLEDDQKEYLEGVENCLTVLR